MQKVQMFDLKPRVDSMEFRALLTELHYRPEPAKLERELENYRSRPDYRAFGCERNGRLAAFAGLHIRQDKEIEVRHLIVDAEFRGRGLGSALLNKLRTAFPQYSFTAETDRDAFEFYRRCGFEVSSLGEKYPGVERFLCRLPARNH